MSSLPQELAGRLDQEDTTPRVWVRQVRSSLDFYLTLGFDVVRAADGWTLLGKEGDYFVLAHNPRLEQTPPSRPVMTVNSSDPAALWQTMCEAGAAPQACSMASPHEEFLVTDPDGNVVLIRDSQTCCVPPPRGRAVTSMFSAPTAIARSNRSEMPGPPKGFRHS